MYIFITVVRKVSILNQNLLHSLHVMGEAYPLGKYANGI